MLTKDGCRARQQRLLSEMHRREWDLFVTGCRFTAYYLTGSLAPAESPVFFALHGDGASALVTPGNRGNVCADTVDALELYSAHRCVTEPYHDGAAILRQRLRPAARVAVERSGTPAMFEGEDASATILALRKRKEEDEIAEIRAALKLCAAAYDAARTAIAPGRTEIDVYNEMQAAVNREAGTSVPLRGDFACGERGIKEGGPPTRRVLLPGDLYILDLFPAPSLYFGDTCRTFAVTEPTAAQLHAYDAVRAAVKLAEEMIRPGVAAAAVHRAVKDLLDSEPAFERSFWHHTGHGIGHRGHEAPRLIAESPDVFEVGDVVTIEPGVYTSALQGGIRLEDNYVVREQGLENLFGYASSLNR